MLVLEFKASAKKSQTMAIDEAIRTSQFVRNKVLRYWIDNRGVGKKELYQYNTQLRAEFEFVKNLNSHACQASVENVERAINRFFDNCAREIKGKKGYPKFKRNCRSVEYKTSGWNLLGNRKSITFSDKKGIGTLKLKGTYDLNFYDIKQIKRVRIVRRADGYYVQFCIAVDVKIESEPTGQVTGLDLGLKYFIADDKGDVEPAPQFYRQAQKQLNRANRKKSKKFSSARKKAKQRQSNNYHKARSRYARKHLRVSRQRKEYCKRLAYSVIQSNDLVAYEDLNVKGLVRNRHLAKSISDAGWYTFRLWLEYFGHKYKKATVAVPPHNTSQNCSSCGQKVKKSLSTRTHICPDCGFAEDRDVNAAINILKLGLNTVGHTGIYALGDLPASSVGVNLLGYGESLNQESPAF